MFQRKHTKFDHPPVNCTFNIMNMQDLPAMNISYIMIQFYQQTNILEDICFHYDTYHHV